MSKITVTRINEEYVVMRPEWEDIGPMRGTFGMAVDCLADNTNLLLSQCHDHVLNAGDGYFVVIPEDRVCDVEP